MISIKLIKKFSLKLDELVAKISTNSPFYSLAVLPNGYLASSAGLYDNTIKIWNATNASLIKTLTNTYGVLNLAVLNNGYLPDSMTEK